MEISVRQKLQLQKPVFKVVRDLEVRFSETEHKSHKVQTKLFPWLTQDHKFHEIQAYLIIVFDLWRKKWREWEFFYVLFLLFFILIGFELQLWHSIRCWKCTSWFDTERKKYE